MVLEDVRDPVVAWAWAVDGSGGVVSALMFSAHPVAPGGRPVEFHSFRAGLGVPVVAEGVGVGAVGGGAFGAGPGDEVWAGLPVWG